MNLALLADASLPELKKAFPAPFKLTCYETADELEAELPHHRFLLCRSTLKVNASLLKHSSIRYVMTASSGRDHLDEAWLNENQIQILDAKGTNADAVCDYVEACLACLNAQHAFIPRSIGIIGMGEVGSRLFQRLSHFKCPILTYDPLAPGPNARPLMELAHCDLVCIHANLHHTQPYPSANLIGEAFLKLRSKKQVIINAARGGIVEEAALLAYHRGYYCTDVYLNEPHINPNVVKHATLCTPHIAGHTYEAKIDAVRQISIQLHQALQLPIPSFTPHPKVITPPYSPWEETQALKNGADFKSLRKAHKRHKKNEM